MTPVTVMLNVLTRVACGLPTCPSPKASEDSPIGGEGVLIELVQAPPDVVEALNRNRM